MKTRANVRFLLAALLLPFLAASTALADDADKCASALQNAYGKYYGCTMKLYSKATKKGDAVTSLESCERKLDRIVERTRGRFGEACPDLTSAEVVDFANQCVEDTASASTGDLSSADLSVTTSAACTGQTVFDHASKQCVPLADVFATKPPAIESMSVDAEGASGKASVRVTFAQNERKRLPNSFELDVGERTPVKLTATGKDSLVYEGQIAYDEETWSQYREALAESQALAGGALAPVFDGRVVTGEQPVTGQFDVISAGRAAPVLVPALPIVFPAIVDPARTLMITDLAVVEDFTRTFDPCAMPAGTPMGKWTFGFLMQEMANQAATGIDPRHMTRLMLESWLVPQTVNGLTIPERAQMQDVIARWEAASGVAPGGPLDLGLAPFRLHAIVNRLDLRDNSAYGGGNNCGEGRFVFGLLDTDTCIPMRFSVIFEYGVNIPNCKMCRKYARKWLHLQDPTLAPVGSVPYNAALENLTDIFSLAGTNPANPNGSSLNQARTNENALDPTWELREFVLSPATGLLEPDTVKQNPRMDFNETVALDNWVNANATDICANNYTVPDEEPLGTPFLGAAAAYDSSDFFDGSGGSATIPDRCARHELSLNTCAACHGGETNTPFCHVGAGCTRPVGGSAALSGFLTGITVADPADGTPSRTFDDLARRQADLWLAAHMPCFPRLALPILTAVH